MSFSVNDKTWTFDNNGFPTSISQDGVSTRLDVTVGDAQSFVETYGNDNSLRIDLNYANGTTNWVKAKLESPGMSRRPLVNLNNEVLSVVGII